MSPNIMWDRYLLVDSLYVAMTDDLVDCPFSLIEIKVDCSLIVLWQTDQRGTKQSIFMGPVSMVSSCRQRHTVAGAYLRIINCLKKLCRRSFDTPLFLSQKFSLKTSKVPVCLTCRNLK